MSNFRRDASLGDYISFQLNGSSYEGYIVLISKRGLKAQLFSGDLKGEVFVKWCNVVAIDKTNVAP